QKGRKIHLGWNHSAPGRRRKDAHDNRNRGLRRMDPAGRSSLKVRFEFWPSFCLHRRTQAPNTAPFGTPLSDARNDPGTVCHMPHSKETATEFGYMV
ncbi:hypothetical protein, partial [Methylomagnum sp.]